MREQPQTRPQNTAQPPQSVPPTLIRPQSEPDKIVISKNAIQTGRVRIVVDEDWW